MHRSVLTGFFLLFLIQIAFTLPRKREKESDSSKEARDVKGSDHKKVEKDSDTSKENREAKGSEHDSHSVKPEHLEKSGSDKKGSKSEREKNKKDGDKRESPDLVVVRDEHSKQVETQKSQDPPLPDSILKPVDQVKADLIKSTDSTKASPCPHVRCEDPPKDFNCREWSMSSVAKVVHSDCCPLHACFRPDGSVFYHLGIQIEELAVRDTHSASGSGSVQSSYFSESSNNQPVINYRGGSGSNFPPDFAFSQAQGSSYRSNYANNFPYNSPYSQQAPASNYERPIQRAGQFYPASLSRFDNQAGSQQQGFEPASGSSGSFPLPYADQGSPQERLARTVSDIFPQASGSSLPFGNPNPNPFREQSWPRFKREESESNRGSPEFE